MLSELGLVPELANRLHLLRDVPAADGTGLTPGALTSLQAFGAPAAGYRPPEVYVTDQTIRGPHGPVPVRIYRSSSDIRCNSGLVWMHGGGFVSGDLNMPEADVVARELAATKRIVVVSVEYRLCQGGIHFPIPHDDVYAAFMWAQAAGVADEAARWSIGGCSAGANLAAGVAQHLRDDARSPHAVVLAYPVLHDPVPEGDAEDVQRSGSLPPILRFSKDQLSWISRNFLGAHPPETAYAYPGQGDVHDLPRHLIILSEYDDLMPSGRLYSEQLALAGVSVEVELVRGVPHGYLNFAGLDETLASIARIAAVVVQ